MQQPKRLIEVDLPIRRISEHARREKSIRHGHISTLHIWWARRPLAACRAVICASLWPDPADEHCPESFRTKARELMIDWANKHESLSSNETFKRRIAWQKNLKKAESNIELRKSILDFIADFANWDNSTNQYYLETARSLTQVAHEALGGEPGTRPLVVDPFAGGGAIPLEALRSGADTFASDLNPVAVLLNKTVLEYIPKYGQNLADEVRKWGRWIKEQAENELREFYPVDSDGATPIAYLWARTIRCEGPGCGAEVPLIRSLWLSKKGAKSVALRIIPKPHAKKVDFEIILDATSKDGNIGTVARGSATCPCCGFTTPVAKVRNQIKARNGGANDARLLCTVKVKPNEQGRLFRLPLETDFEVVKNACLKLKNLEAEHSSNLSFVPNEISNEADMFNNSLPIYGIDNWAKLFVSRQALALSVLAQKVFLFGKRDDIDPSFLLAIQTCLAFAVDKQADYCSSICRWVSSGEFIGSTFSRQALPIVWDFCEVNPFSNSTGSFLGAIDWIIKVLEQENRAKLHPGQIEICSATKQVLPDNVANLVATDPPYYYSVQYAGLSDFFYVWLKRSLKDNYRKLFDRFLTPIESCINIRGLSPRDGEHVQ